MSSGFVNSLILRRITNLKGDKSSAFPPLNNLNP